MVLNGRSRIDAGAAPGSAGAFVSTQEHLASEQRGFSTEDILWAIGIWSVILTLSPVIIFYMLMVA